jgi:transposase-like protein
VETAMEYSEAFRRRMVQRMTGPRSISATALAAEVGVTQPTLSRWLRDASIVGSVSNKKNEPSKPLSAWTAEEKLLAIVEAARVPEAEFGEWLRSRGLRSTDLDGFRADAISGLVTKPEKLTAAEKKRTKELERELRRTKAALAEAAALLVLRKKAAALWGEEGDDT